MSSQDSKPDLSQMRDLGGIFYPVGYLVAAFPDREAAERVRNDLLTGGYDESDSALYTCAEVAEAASANLSEHRGFLATLAWSDEALKIHLEKAREGAAFLLIYSPNDIETARAMNVIRRVPHEFVHRYHRLAIEEVT